MLTIFGFALAGAGLLARGLMAEGLVRREAERPLLLLAIAGTFILVGGLAYALVRQLRRRRALPSDRYRGPSIVLLLALAVVLALVAAVPFGADAEALLLGGEVTLGGAIVILTGTQLALLLVTWLLVLRPRALAFAMPLFGTAKLRAVRAGLGWGVLAWLGASIVSFLMALLVERLGMPPAPEPADQAIAVLDPWLIVLAVVVLAPIAEELFFRGVALNAWLRERGRRFAYIGSSALFAAIHISLVSLLPIFLLGLALAWVYRRTGSLLAPIVMHATVNGISVGLALLIRYEVVRVPA